MFLDPKNITNQHPRNQQIEDTGSIPINLLPEELILEIFSYLKLATLGTICLVSKEWKRLAEDPTLWKIAIYKQIAITSDNWAQWFGSEVVKNENRNVEFSSLPLEDIIKDYRSLKLAFPEINMKKDLTLAWLPKNLNTKLTLKNLGELAKKCFTESETGYQYIWPPVMNELGNEPIKNSCWGLMINILPGSKDIGFSKQQDMIADLAKNALIGYEAPKTLETAFFTLAKYFNSNIRLLNDNPWTYTRCQQFIKEYQIIVGGFGLKGLQISMCRDEAHVPSIGIAAVRIFYTGL